MPRRYQYCPHCATSFIDRELYGHLRQVCPSCDFIFWQNPVVGVAVIVMDADRIVLGRRARGVYQGAWCIPCGYVEYDEDVRQAAQREFQEETGLCVEVGEVYAVHSNFHNPAMHPVHLVSGVVLGGRCVLPMTSLRWRTFPASGTRQPGLSTDRLVLAQLQRDYGHVVEGLRIHRPISTVPTGSAGIQGINLG
jgi:8-oxo-dGTP pyrophosphatase MutT (NUDIX family)